MFVILHLDVDPDRKSSGQHRGLWPCFPLFAGDRFGPPGCREVTRAGGPAEGQIPRVEAGSGLFASPGSSMASVHLVCGRGLEGTDWGDEVLPGPV